MLNDYYDYINFVIVCVIFYVFIFHVIDALPIAISQYQYICVSECNTDMCKNINKQFRDTDYWLDPNGNFFMNPMLCKLTMYELSHLLFHVWISYKYGFLLSVSFGIFFEIFEHYFYNCGSVLDVFWNFIGAMIGIFLKY